MESGLDSSTTEQLETQDNITEQSETRDDSTEPSATQDNSIGAETSSDAIDEGVWQRRLRPRKKTATRGRVIRRGEM